MCSSLPISSLAYHSSLRFSIYPCIHFFQFYFIMSRLTLAICLVLLLSFELGSAYKEKSGKKDKQDRSEVRKGSEKDRYVRSSQDDIQQSCPFKAKKDKKAAEKEECGCTGKSGRISKRYVIVEEEEDVVQPKYIKSSKKGKETKVNTLKSSKKGTKEITKSQERVKRDISDVEPKKKTRPVLVKKEFSATSSNLKSKKKRVVEVARPEGGKQSEEIDSEKEVVEKGKANKRYVLVEGEELVYKPVKREIRPKQKVQVEPEIEQISDEVELAEEVGEESENDENDGEEENEFEEDEEV